LLSVEVLDPGGDDKTPKTKRPLIDGQTLLAWAKNYHWKQDRVSDDFWTQRLNPLIALAAGIAHKSYNGDTGFGSLDLKPLFLEFPRVVEAIASKLPDKILALNTEGAKQAGLSPIFDFLAQNIDKYYVHDNKAFLIDNSDQ
jgi:hypothetical protein